MAERLPLVNAKKQHYNVVMLAQKVQFSTQIARDGFAILPSVLNVAEVTVLAKKLRSCELPRSRAGIRHAMRDPSVSAVAHEPRLLGIACEVLGQQAFPFRATLFDKSPDANWLVPWHQDTALPLEERRETSGWGPWSIKNSVNYAHAPASVLEQILALRLHLDDSCSDNGPLRVLPGTHMQGVLSDGQLQELSARGNSVDCLVERGGVVAMRPLVVHASSKSQSAAPRRVLHIEYAAERTLGDALQLMTA